MEDRIKIGCCGFPVARKRYYETYMVVELQQTFYQLPMLKTAQKWRQDAPPGFEFTMKVPQLITHETTSPTYRRYKIAIPQEESKNYGSFKPTKEVMNAWQDTKGFAEALGAKILVFQCPTSFTPSSENKKNLRRFFSTVERGDFIFVWEPRGNWEAEDVKGLCKEFDLIHGVDPFKHEPLHGKLRYFRLHGKTGYNYHFTKQDLKWLKERWTKGGVYFLFNNTSMFKDSCRFIALLRNLPYEQYLHST